LNKYVAEECILGLQSVVFSVNNSGTIINNTAVVTNMRICQACNKEKWPVDEHGMQQACLTPECVEKVLVIINDLDELSRKHILNGYAHAISRRYGEEEEE
jgi:hypothetical protein